jgi:hypothetical protein
MLFYKCKLSVLQARTQTDAEEGLLFMQEMVQLAKTQSQQPDTPPQAVAFMARTDNDEVKQVVLTAGPAHFGHELRATDEVSLVTCHEYFSLLKSVLQVVNCRSVRFSWCRYVM